MSSCKLKFKPEKIEVILLGSKCKQLINGYFPVCILGHLISSSLIARNYGVQFNFSLFSFNRHVQSVFKSCCIALGDLGCVRIYLSQETVTMAGNALAGSVLTFTILSFKVFHNQTSLSCNASRMVLQGLYQK